MTDATHSGRTGNRQPWPVGNNVDRHVVRPRGASKPVPSGASSGALLMSVIFIVVLITDPHQLDLAWTWIRDLPMVVEAFAWIILLPWMLAYLAWNAPWDLWLRLALVAILTGGFAMDFWRPAQD